MVVTGDFLFLVLVILALGLTFIALRANLVLFRFGAALAWLTLGILLLTGNLGISVLTDTWAQVLGFVFLVMTFAPFLLQFVTETRREARGKDVGGYPGAESASWTEWGPKPKKPKLTADQQSAQRMREHRDKLRSIRGRFR